MAGRLSRLRRAAFLVALVVSAAVYAYSVTGIMGTGSELRSVVSARVGRALGSGRVPPGDRGSRGLPRPSSRGARGALTARSSTSATRPPSWRAERSSRPPWAAATARTIDRPTPAPRRSRRRSRRWKGSVSSWTLSSGTRGPVLVTLSATRSPRGPTHTSAKPPRQLCVMAFSTRLKTSCSSRPRSPLTTLSSDSTLSVHVACGGLRLHARDDEPGDLG